MLSGAGTYLPFHDKMASRFRDEHCIKVSRARWGREVDIPHTSIYGGDLHLLSSSSNGLLLLFFSNSLSTEMTRECISVTALLRDSTKSILCKGL